MRKNGTFFILIVDCEQLLPSVWAPYSYRTNSTEDYLGNYVTVSGIKKTRELAVTTPFRPIEYRDIPRRGGYLTCVLERSSEGSKRNWPLVGEQQLLFGTMRAYLGNVLVTPKAHWLNLKGPLYFPIKSEFVLVVPRDNCLYFWWAYMQSTRFLANLPLGSGGTRPRLHMEALEQTPVEIPDTEIRQEIHERLEEIAEREWSQYVKTQELLDSLEAL